jgi:dihydrofolate reductase
MSQAKTDARRLYVSMIVSLDGFIEGPSRELDWFLDGDPAFEGYCTEMIDSVGVALFGRRSYELMVSYWPAAEASPRSPADLAFAQKMNALPKVVLSRTLKSAEWRNTRIVGDDAVAAIRALKQEAGKPIVAWAGAGLVSTLRQHQLVDEYRLIIHPILLGGGTRLFDALGERERLRLVRTTQLGQELVMLCYEPLR